MPDQVQPEARPALDRYDRMPVGVVVERRPARNRWEEHVWRPVAVVPGAPEHEPWSVMRELGEATQFFAGVFALELHPKETVGYEVNLAAAAPAVYVVLAPDAAARFGWALRFVTVSPYDAEPYADGQHLIEPVPMPEEILAWLTDYMADYHRPEEFRKRKRKRHDPEKGFGLGAGSNDHGPSTE